jgi:hypothetical protein
VGVSAGDRRHYPEKNKIFAISVAAPAIPVKPRTPAIRATIRKVRIQLSMSLFITEKFGYDKA